MKNLQAQVKSLGIVHFIREAAGPKILKVKGKTDILDPTLVNEPFPTNKTEHYITGVYISQAIFHQLCHCLR